MDWIIFDAYDKSTWPPRWQEVVFWYNAWAAYNALFITWDTGAIGHNYDSGKFCFCTKRDIMIDFPAVYCWAAVDRPDWL